jgi:hypothetical protein
MAERVTARDIVAPRPTPRRRPLAGARALGTAGMLASLAALLIPSALVAQVPDTATSPRAPSLVVPKPTGAPPITPRRAFLYSLAAPGSAQSILGRPTAGSIFVAAEAGTLAMIAKSLNDLRAARAVARDSVVTGYTVPTNGTVPVPVYDRTPGAKRAQTRIPARRAHVEDWITLLIVNHFLAGADAYVAANLWDVPTDVSVSPSPTGGVQLGARFAW